VLVYLAVPYLDAVSDGDDEDAGDPFEQVSAPGEVNADLGLAPTHWHLEPATALGLVIACAQQLLERTDLVRIRPRLVDVFHSGG